MQTSTSRRSRRKPRPRRRRPTRPQSKRPRRRRRPPGNRGAAHSHRPPRTQPSSNVTQRLRPAAQPGASFPRVIQRPTWLHWRIQVAKASTRPV
ncbi:hypothetical protein DN402_34230 [Streptomyces sp. SW4]|nr:hypothetical protein DN402_34230 [Streptomyces sp. SW4]